ncbi:unnamed protein product, partial [Staurois parvus]
MLSTQPRLQKRKVKKKKRRPPQNESESEEENKLRSNYPKHRRPPVRDSRRGQQPASPAQRNASTGKHDKMAKLCKCHMTHPTSKDTAETPADKENKLASPSPRSADFMGDYIQRQHQTARQEHAKSAVTIQPWITRIDHHNGSRIQREDSMQAIHRRLDRALREKICHSEVELSDSSDSTDIYSIAEEKLTHEMISGEEITQLKLDQQVRAGRRELDNGGKDARSGPFMSTTEELALQDTD